MAGVVILIFVVIWLLTPNPKTSPIAFANVEGIVTLDGKPFPGAVVVFHPEASNGTFRSYRGQTQADEKGHYSIAIDEINYWNHKMLGVAIGPNKVTIGNPTNPIGQPIPGKVDPKQLDQQVPDRYKDLKSTPLKYSIHPGSQTIDLSLSSQ